MGKVGRIEGSFEGRECVEIYRFNYVSDGSDEDVGIWYCIFCRYCLARYYNDLNVGDMYVVCRW